MADPSIDEFIRSSDRVERTQEKNICFGKNLQLKFNGGTTEYNFKICHALQESQRLVCCLKMLSSNYGPRPAKL